jgi:hypothetical protein
MYPTSHPSRPDRFCRVSSLLCILTLLAAVTLLFPAAAASLSESSGVQGPLLQTSDDLASSALAERSIEEMERTASAVDQIPGKGKIASDLLNSPQMQRQGLSGEEGDGAGPALVYITLVAGAPTSLIDPLVDGVVDRDEEHHLVAASVTGPELTSLAANPLVKGISRVGAPLVSAGRTVTSGDTLLRADQLRAQYGASGAGVKIGVISDGVEGLAEARATGDLPADLHLLSASDGGNEGTAMLEIIHDVAPQATLYFHEHGSTVIAFNRAVDTLVAAGCTVIVDDICWPKEPFFEQGIVATHISSVIAAKQVIYVSAASNYADQHYLGAYYNGGDNFHDFSAGTSIHRNMYVDLPAGTEVSAVLQWDDRFGSSGSDYDLYFVDAVTGAVLDWSTYRQDGDDDPIETIEYQNNGFETIEGEFIIRNYRGAAPVRTLDLFVYPDDDATMYTNNVNPEGSIYGHQAVPDVVTVGAVRADGVKSITIEPFSSRGPVRLVYPSPQTIVKPDICAPDRSAVSGAGGFEKIFVGTSASAPHVAGVIAQVWGLLPNRSATEIRTALYASAIDLGASGRDTVYGYGLADAVQMYTAAGGGTVVPPVQAVPVTPAPTVTVQPSASLQTSPINPFQKSSPFGLPGATSFGTSTIGTSWSAPVPAASVTAPPAPSFVRWYPWGR